MKIAFIGQKGLPTNQGGIEKHVEELTQQLAELGFDISVYSRPHYTGKNEKRYFLNGIQIINLPSINTKHLDAISHTLFASLHALTQDYDIIHYHGVGPSLLAFIPRLLKPKVKVVATFHCLDRQHQKWGGFARLMLHLGEWAACRFPHQTITISQTLTKYCLYEYGVHTIYIPNGVKIREAANKNILRDLGLEPQKYILTVSRLVRHKGIHTLINAYNQLTTDHKLVIVGDSAKTDGYVKELKSLAQNNPQIIFAGRQTGQTLTALFENASLFVQPSEAEGLSIALLEALAHGVPVIISNIEENQEACENLSLEFANKSSLDLKRKLEYAVANPDVMAALAQKAKLRAEREYDWTKIGKETANLYGELIIEKKVAWENVN